ncbi:hypothetical protein GCM10011515_20540 [Tsuneonella deserti]|uniref:Phage shock protein B n=1 Tax=Tsuneonella deserti TaxID=2035528 RepID=A0ABQ1S930_9SPHN|nr:hypothetical protein [Tsuneonella deserti]GGE00644.1 hypothetical protein GCM10011515_20540 [Tsuneonella deserti]
MSPGTALVAIIAILAVMIMRIVKYNTDRRSSPPEALPDTAENVALRREVEDLRERVRVLERIATDANTTTALESRRVAEEIEALRDTRQS